MEENKEIQETASSEAGIHRGDIFEASLDPVIGCEQSGTRPVLIIQNDIGNRFSPTVIAAVITSKLRKRRLPTHVFISAKTTGLSENSMVLLEQIRTIDRQRLRERCGHISGRTMDKIDEALKISLNLI